MAGLTGTPFLPPESEPVHSTGYPLRREPTFPKGSTWMRKGLETILAGCRINASAFVEKVSGSRPGCP